MENIISPKLQDGKSWAVDCAALIKGSVKEDCLDELGAVKSSKVIFNAEKK